LPDLHFPKQRALFGFRRRAKTLPPRGSDVRVSIARRSTFSPSASSWRAISKARCRDAFAADQIRAAALNRANFGNVIRGHFPDVAMRRGAPSAPRAFEPKSGKSGPDLRAELA